MRRSRRIRLCYALPSDAMLAALSSAAAFLAVAATLLVPKMEAHPWILAFILTMMGIAGGGLLLVIAVLVFRIFFEYQRRTYDLATVNPLVIRFESDSMEKNFTLGARRTLEIISQGWQNVDHATDVEPVLDFLEDIGFALNMNQISDELAHHYFYPSVQAYFLMLKDYIKENQKTYGKATWQYIEPLFERTFLIEHKLDREAQKHPPKEEIIEFFKLDAQKQPRI